MLVNLLDFKMIDAQAKEIAVRVLKKHGLNLDSSLNVILEHRKEIYYEIFKEVQAAAKSYNTEQLQKERLEINKRLESEMVYLQTPNSIEKEEQLYVKRLNDDYKLRGEFLLLLIFFFLRNVQNWTGKREHGIPTTFYQASHRSYAPKI